MNIDNPEINDNQIVTEQAQIANMWENNNNNLENDDFDSDQLDEDESYSWASGITDNQDLAQNGGGGGGSTLIGCSGGSGGTGGCSSSAANWRDWRSNNISNELLDNLAVLNRIGSHFAMKLSNYNNSNNNNSNSINGQVNSRLIINTNSPILSLVDLCSKYIAANLPFELVESFKQPVPEDLQLKITYASFPDNTENIRLYSCLANGCVDEYLRGEQLYHNRCVRKIMQIGFHLSAQVIISSPLGINGNNSSLNSAIAFINKRSDFCLNNLSSLIISNKTQPKLLKKLDIIIKNNIYKYIFYNKLTKYLFYLNNFHYFQIQLIQVNYKVKCQI